MSELGGFLMSELMNLPRPNETHMHTGCISWVYRLPNALTLGVLGLYPRPWDPMNPHHNIHPDSVFEGAIYSDKGPLNFKLEESNTLDSFEIGWVDFPKSDAKRIFKFRSRDIRKIIEAIGSWQWSDTISENIDLKSD